MSAPRRNRRAVGYTPLGLLRRLWLLATGRQSIVAGECLQCGNCCREINLSRKNHWIRSEADFRRLAAEHPEYGRFKHIGYTVTGLMKFQCEFITAEGFCGDYENRPDICRDYPERDLYFMGGELTDLCGYSFRIVPSFRRMLKREMKHGIGYIPADSQED